MDSLKLFTAEHAESAELFMKNISAFFAISAVKSSFGSKTSAGKNSTSLQEAAASYPEKSNYTAVLRFNV